MSPTPSTVIPIHPASTTADTGTGRRRPGFTPKGRQVNDAARARVAALCEGLEARADLLIEHLHRLNDAEGALRRGQLAALAERLRLSQVEVFEVASFYHHFRIVDDADAVPAITVRVCNSLSCALAGADALLADTQRALAGQQVVPGRQPIPIGW